MVWCGENALTFTLPGSAAASAVTPFALASDCPPMIIGIDLGTTNSVVGVWRDGAVVLNPNALGHSLTPSTVGIGDDGAILVGLPARERLPTHPALTTTAFKRYMGTDRMGP